MVKLYFVFVFIATSYANPIFPELNTHVSTVVQLSASAVGGAFTELKTIVARDGNALRARFNNDDSALQYSSNKNREFELTENTKAKSYGIPSSSQNMPYVNSYAGATTIQEIQPQSQNNNRRMQAQSQSLPSSLQVQFQSQDHNQQRQSQSQSQDNNQQRQSQSQLQENTHQRPIQSSTSFGSQPNSNIQSQNNVQLVHPEQIFFNNQNQNSENLPVNQQSPVQVKPQVYTNRYSSTQRTTLYRTTIPSFISYPRTMTQTTTTPRDSYDETLNKSTTTYKDSWEVPTENPNTKIPIYQSFPNKQPASNVNQENSGSSNYNQNRPQSSPQRDPSQGLQHVVDENPVYSPVEKVSIIIEYPTEKYSMYDEITTRRPLKRPPVYKKQDDRKNSPVESSTTNAVESSSPEIAEEDTK